MKTFAWLLLLPNFAGASDLADPDSAALLQRRNSAVERRGKSEELLSENLAQAQEMTSTNAKFASHVLKATRHEEHQEEGTKRIHGVEHRCIGLRDHDVEYDLTLEGEHVRDVVLDIRPNPDSDACHSQTVAFRLKGRTGAEQATIIVGEETHTAQLSQVWQDFFFARPENGKVQVSFDNAGDEEGDGRDVFMIPLMPRAPMLMREDLWEEWNCGRADEHQYCNMARAGHLACGGTYTLDLEQETAFFRLKGKTGEEQITIGDGDLRATYTLTTEFSDFAIPHGRDNSFYINFDTRQRGREVHFQSVYPQEDDISHVHKWQRWNCGSRREHRRCGEIRSGILKAGGLYLIKAYDTMADDLVREPAPIVPPKPLDHQAALLAEDSTTNSTEKAVQSPGFGVSSRNQLCVGMNTDNCRSARAEFPVYQSVRCTSCYARLSADLVYHLEGSGNELTSVRVGLQNSQFYGEMILGADATFDLRRSGSVNLPTPNAFTVSFMVSVVPVVIDVRLPTQLQWSWSFSTFARFRVGGMVTANFGNQQVSWSRGGRLTTSNSDPTVSFQPHLQVEAGFGVDANLGFNSGIEIVVQRVLSYTLWAGPQLTLDGNSLNTQHCLDGSANVNLEHQAQLRFELFGWTQTTDLLSRRSLWSRALGRVFQRCATFNPLR